MTDRYEREKEWHDQAYSEGRRDAVVGKYYAINESRVRFYENLILSRCPSRCSGLRMLEYGVGREMETAALLAQRGASVEAIDISEVAVEQARENARLAGIEGQISFRVANAEALPFDDDTFDIICGTAIIHHLDLRNAYSEIARVMRPDGVALFTEPLGHNPVINLYRKLTPSLRTEDEHPLVVEDIELARPYFETVEVHYFHLSSLAAVPLGNTRFFARSLKALEGLDRLPFRHVPPLRKYAWYTVIELAHPKW